MTSIAEAFAPIEIDHLAVPLMANVWRPVSPVPSDVGPLTKDIFGPLHAGRLHLDHRLALSQR
jgi:hypothetical protein